MTYIHLNYGPDEDGNTQGETIIISEFDLHKQDYLHEEGGIGNWNYRENCYCRFCHYFRVIKEDNPSIPDMEAKKMLEDVVNSE